MTTQEFELLLTAVAARTTEEVRRDDTYHNASKFEERVRVVLQELGKDLGVMLSPSEAQTFPDIVVKEFGIEVKVTQQDVWRSVANSVFEGSRAAGVEHIYVMFGKMGGTPEVKWGRYEDSVMHVRTSHVPRFEVQIGTEEPLFKKFGISYQDFRKLKDEEKMEYIRKYALGRLEKGQRFWWLEAKPVKDQEHSVDVKVRLFMNLKPEEKRQLRAEAALLSPKIVASSRARNKYSDAILYSLTYRGIWAGRDAFSAGSVAGKERGGNYVLRALQDIEPEMRKAAQELEDALFVEYWGESVPPERRIEEWLRRADDFAKGWRPSNVLFLDKKK
jgi:hypothetical protein